MAKAFIVGKTRYLYNIFHKVVKAHILHFLPHPEDPDNRLIVFRHWSIYTHSWHYEVTDANFQASIEKYVDDALKRIREKRKYKPKPSDGKVQTR